MHVVNYFTTGSIALYPYRASDGIHKGKGMKRLIFWDRPPVPRLKIALFHGIMGSKKDTEALCPSWPLDFILLAAQSLFGVL